MSQDFFKKDSYEALVHVEVNQGKFEWCYQHGYWVLTQNNTEIKQFLRVNILMNKQLRADINKLEIYDETGFLAHYSIEPIRNLYYRGEFSPLYVNMLRSDKNFKIKFGTKTVSSSTFSHNNHMKIVYEQDIIVRAISSTIKSDDICPICLESATIEKSHITPCMHKFHVECIEMDINIRGKKINFFGCSEVCKHSSVIIDYECPVCRKRIELESP